MKLITLGIIVCLSLVTLSSQGAPPDKEAWAAYENGNYTESYHLFFQLFRENPQDERITFGLGLAALKTGKLSHAKFAFERILASSPDNQRARLELGRTLTAMGLYELARDEFQKVLQYNPPEQVRTNVENFLGQIKRSARPWTAEAQLSLGAFYDDNINIGPSESLIDTGVGRLQVDPHSLPETAVGLSAGLNAAGTYDIGMREDWLLTAGLNTIQTWLPDTPEYELRYLRAQAGVRHSGTRTILDLPLKYENLNYGHDPYVNIAGVEPLFLFAASPEWHHFTQGGLEYRAYQDDENRDGLTYRLNQTVKRFFGPARHSLALTAGAFHEDADLGGFVNQGPEASLTGELRPCSATTLYGMVAYHNANYQDILLTDLQTEARSDHEMQYVTGVRQSLTKRWVVDLNYRHVDTHSNFDLYSYERNIVSVSTYLCF